MRRTTSAFALVLFAPWVSYAQDHWWCGGDGWWTGLACERNTAVSDARVYDDFDVPVRSTVRGGWGNFLLWGGDTPSQAYYEIRSAVTVGDGGILHAAGEMDVRASPTGRIIKGIAEYLVRGDFPQPVTLDAGRYWITVAPIGNGTGEWFVSNTRGWDELPEPDPSPPPLGIPRRNHNSFFDSLYYNRKFVDTRQELGDGTWDFAFGVGPNTGPPARVLPEAMYVFYGIQVQGNVEDLHRRFGGYVQIQQRAYPNLSAPNAQLIVEARLPFKRAGYLALEVHSCVTAFPRDGVLFRVAYFDIQHQEWVTVYEETAGKDGCQPITPFTTMNAERYIDQNTGLVRAALSWFDRGTASLNWSATIDETIWFAEPQ